ncbi:MAG: hypothetical protein JSU95_00915 [Betaproteobacteria bacterium]|nr:MAG: hypothetical protein JSU95_00915 [Betaproteobacteria bacterium]
MRTILNIFRSLIIAVCVTGCASTELTNSWRDPGYTQSVTSLVVLGVSNQASVRRVFEDEFAAQLRSRGIRAIPSYTLIADDGQIDEERLRTAIESANTDGVIITRLASVKDVTLATTGPSAAPYYYGYYSRAWIRYYEPVVQQYEVVTLETTIFALGRAEPVWSGTTETFAPEDVKRETAGFAKVVMKALAAEGLI